MKRICRRYFIKKTAAAGAGLILGASVFDCLIGPDSGWAQDPAPADLSVVKGEDRYAITVKAVEQLGGMDKYVQGGAKVGLLVNCAFRHWGSVVHPSIVLAVVSMIYEAGAKEIVLLKDPAWGYWNHSPLKNKYKDEIKSLKSDSGRYKTIEIPDGASLKDPQVVADLMDCDVFINMPIIKHHGGVHITGALKNMMGLCPYNPTCKYFHNGSGTSGWYGDVDHLSQCIADLNLIRKPDLCVADATEFITTNGPIGPGKLKKPQKVIASVDRVSIDAYGSTLMGLEPQDILMLSKAAAHGLGVMDLDRVRIKETTI